MEDVSARIEAARHVSELRSLLQERHGFLKNTVDIAATNFGPTWIADLEDTLAKLFPSRDALALAAKGYALFVLHLLRAQRRFEEDGVYEPKSYAQASEDVYFDENYMMSEYLPALLLSHYLWPHHYRQLRFFDTTFLSQMQLHSALHFAEVGLGTGLYSRRALQAIASARASGFDISPASARFAEQHVGAFGLHDRFDVVLQDVTTHPIPACDWLICVEVLEHLEDPVGFLRVLREALTPGGRAFITAALNAPHVDHIYLYRNPEDVLDQLEMAGFALEQSFVAPAFSPPAPGSPVPTVAAYVVV